jgi:hypothetical protein
MRYKTVRYYIKSFQEMEYSVLECNIWLFYITYFYICTIRFNFYVLCVYQCI